MFLHIGILIAGLILIVLAADYFVMGASLLAKRFHVSKLVIGLTVVALGTSVPEFGVNIVSSVQGYGDVALGNILGSNISNILLIFAGSVAVMRSIAISRNSVRQIELVVVVSLAVLAASVFPIGAPHRSISVIEGVLLVSSGFVYWSYLYRIAKKGILKAEDDALPSEGNSRISSTGAMIATILLSLTVLLYGSKLVTQSAIEIALGLGMSEFLVAGTIIAIGTSLPELVTSIQAVRQKQFDLMFGNVAGSNIINTLFILGTSAFISPIMVLGESQAYVYMNIIAPVLVLGGITLFSGRKFRRWQATVLIILYVLFLLFTIQR